MREVWSDDIIAAHVGTGFEARTCSKCGRKGNVPAGGHASQCPCGQESFLTMTSRDTAPLHAKPDFGPRGADVSRVFGAIFAKVFARRTKA